MRLLAIDTSGARGSIALLDDEAVIAEQDLTLDRKASTTLLPAIEQLFTGAGFKRSDLTALAVALGPGSFTGIRIGLATAQGMAQALNLPVYGLSSLRVLAEQYQGEAGNRAVLRRARAEESYFCIYDECWKETVAEGRYSDDEIGRILSRFHPLQMAVEKGSDFDFSRAGIAPQIVSVHAAALGRLAHRLSPDDALARGEGLEPRHYSPNFPTKKS